jgi:hypothetical protein
MPFDWLVFFHVQLILETSLIFFLNEYHTFISTSKLLKVYEYIIRSLG